jgi:hypothetical protein
MHSTALAAMFVGALLAFCVVHAFRVWFALRNLRDLPNVIQIHKVKKVSARFDTAA